ncbi:unnamed protein product [Sphacelaria rigidula]
MSAAPGGGAGLMGTASRCGGGTAQQEHGGAAQGGSSMFLASARTHGSTPREKTLRKKMRARKRRIRRLYMLVQNLIKTVLGRGFRAVHDFHLAQLLKTHGTPVAVIDCVAAHGFCMTESMRYKREQFYVKWRMDRHVLALALRVAAIPWDTWDFWPTTSVTGVGAHVSTKAATCVAVENLPGHLSLMHAHRRQGDLVAADITTGPSWHRDGQRWERFLSVFDDAAFRCAVARIAGEGGHIETCVEIELRQTVAMMQRDPQVFEYLFMQVGTTKSWSDSKAAIDRLADIRHVDERGAAAPCMVAGDEETFRFMYHLIRSNPGHYHWLRIYVGDWHLLYHMAKVIMSRFWGAGIEFVAEALGVDGTKASEASNDRVAHHTISVFFEAMWGKIVAMYDP